MRRFCAMLLTILCMLTTGALAFGNSEHDAHLELVLFGDELFSQSQPADIKAAIQSLKHASYLALDQYNGGGQTQLDYLHSVKVSGIPRYIADFNFSGNSTHRSYTHRGWNFSYVIDKANWQVRKDLLIASSNKILDFGLLSNRLLGYDKRSESFAALLYYVHVLGDHLADKELNSREELRIPFAGHLGRDKYDIIQELLPHFDVLFEQQKNGFQYSAFVNELKSINERVSALESSEGGINTQEKFVQRQEYAQKLLEVLGDYVPNLLKKEDYFSRVFFPEKNEQEQQAG